MDTAGSCPPDRSAPSTEPHRPGCRRPAPGAPPAGTADLDDDDARPAGPRHLDPDAGHPRHRDHPDLLRLGRGACDLRSREVLTALVVDPSLASRRRIGTLLRLGGWHVLEATSSRQAQRAAAGRELDLVVTEVTLRGETGLALLARLRVAGSRARFLVVTADPTDRVRSAAASVGAMACLAKPIDPRAVIWFLAQRVQAPTPRARHLRVVRDVEDASDADAEVDAAMLERLQEMFLSALPHRLSLIA